MGLLKQYRAKATTFRDGKKAADFESKEQNYTTSSSITTTKKQRGVNDDDDDDSPRTLFKKRRRTPQEEYTEKDHHRGERCASLRVILVPLHYPRCPPAPALSDGFVNGRSRASNSDGEKFLSSV